MDEKEQTWTMALPIGVIGRDRRWDEDADDGRGKDDDEFERWLALRLALNDVADMGLAGKRPE